MSITLSERPITHETQIYNRLETRRVEAGLKYWVRHGSAYWDEKAKKAKSPEQRYKAKLMRRIGAAFVLSARYYLNCLSMLIFLAEQIDASNEAHSSVRKELEDAGILRRQHDEATARKQAAAIKRTRAVLKAMLKTTEELRSYIM